MIDKSLNDKVVTIREHAFKKDDVILKRYRVLRELGRGGMGIVYLCRDLVANVEVCLAPRVRTNLCRQGCVPNREAMMCVTGDVLR